MIKPVNRMAAQIQLRCNQKKIVKRTSEERKEQDHQLSKRLLAS